jgi:C-terminal processing protease CtpA/Prc
MSRFTAAIVASLLVLSCLTGTSVFAADESFGGVGLQVVPTITGDLVVLNVLEDAPAAAMGLLPGDLIFQVDDFPLQGSDFGKVISEHLWGAVGSSVELSFRRPGVAGVSKVVLQRSTIDPRLTVTPTVLNRSLGSAKGN